MFAAGTSHEELPPEVRKLVADHITSVEQLEIILLLREQPDQVWTAHDVSERLRTSERSAAARLPDLVARGFAVELPPPGNGGGPGYRYAPSTAVLAADLDKLAAEYADRRFSVIALIFDKPIGHLRVYADAFRLRKKDDDG